VGGIYTVLKTKAPVTCREYGDRFYMMGPLSYAKSLMEVEQLPPSNPAIKAALDNMAENGVRYVHGRWLIEGAPTVILFDLGSVGSRLDEWKGDIWQQARIPSPPHDTETNDAILLGYLVSWFLQKVAVDMLIVSIWKTILKMPW
jgi:glycogen(starch) synthase